MSQKAAAATRPDLDAELNNLAMSKAAQPLFDAVKKHIAENVQPMAEEFYRLGEGRKDDSGDFTKGAGLSPAQIEKLESFVDGAQGNEHRLENMRMLIEGSASGEQGGATGTDDFILPFTKATLALFDAHHIKYSYTQSEGGHTWPNWRSYLNTFAPLLFR